MTTMTIVSIHTPSLLRCPPYSWIWDMGQSLWALDISQWPRESTTDPSNIACCSSHFQLWWSNENPTPLAGPGSSPANLKWSLYTWCQLSTSQTRAWGLDTQDANQRISDYTLCVLVDLVDLWGLQKSVQGEKRTCPQPGSWSRPKPRRELNASLLHCML